MEEDFVELLDPEVSADDLALPRARSMATFLRSGANPYLKPIAFLQMARERESIIFDVEVERPQRPRFDIRHSERISITFLESDNTYPEVVALRKDFPLVPHTNLRPYELPKSLCLYDVSWSDLKLEWTPQKFAEQLRTWLAKTATGTLHAEDQSLEPLIPLFSERIVLPISILERSASKASLLRIEKIVAGPKTTLMARPISEPSAGVKIGDSMACVFETPAVAHGVIRHEPKTVADLCTMLLEHTGFDLLAAIREKLRQWHESGQITPALRKARMALVLHVPHKRTNDGPVESRHTWVFVMTDEIIDIGEDVGLWLKMPAPSAEYGWALPVDPERKGSKTALLTLNPVYELTPEMAAVLNGLNSVETRKFAQIGAGAIGGSLFMNLQRAGYGIWTLIDDDVLLPHNLARFASVNGAGFAKVDILTSHANILFGSSERANSLMEDVLCPRDSAKLASALVGADIILDCSASISVARKLALEFQEAKGRRVSVFLSPSGKDSVALIESRDRRCRLDVLEMQYYRLLIRDSTLADHLFVENKLTRYARSCADVSSSIPNDMVQFHAAIASMHLKDKLASQNGSATIWRFGEHKKMSPVEIPISHFREHRLGDWTVVVDEILIEDLLRRRQLRLPNETGGVLLGAFDMSRKFIYVVDTLDSPADSVESPHGYVRGSSGNVEALQKINTVTMGNIVNVGEWHSHPDGSATRPSGDDVGLLAKISLELQPEGLPGLIMIVGQNSEISFVLGRPQL